MFDPKKQFLFCLSFCQIFPAHIHQNMHVCEHICIYARIYAHMRAYIHKCEHICIYASIYAYMHAYSHTCSHIYASIYASGFRVPPSPIPWFWGKNPPYQWVGVQGFTAPFSPRWVDEEIWNQNPGPEDESFDSQFPAPHI